MHAEATSKIAAFQATISEASDADVRRDEFEKKIYNDINSKEEENGHH